MFYANVGTSRAMDRRTFQSPEAHLREIAAAYTDYTSSERRLLSASLQ